MKFDAYKVGGDKVLVYKQGKVDEYGDLPEGKPLYESTADGDWWDWCDSRSDWRDGERIRICEPVGTYAASFANDVERKAQSLLDRYISQGSEAGWGRLEIDHSGMTYTFRRNAAWKDEPAYYTLQQPLKWTERGDEPLSSEDLRIRDSLVWLCGMADALHELGLDLAFDAGFKIHLFGVRKMWKTSFDE